MRFDNLVFATQDKVGALRPATIVENRNPKPNLLGCAGRYLLLFLQSLHAQ